MTDLIRVPQQNHWLRLKALVLDSVSSPITRRVYNLGLDEFFAWYGRAPQVFRASRAETGTLVATGGKCRDKGRAQREGSR